MPDKPHERPLETDEDGFLVDPQSWSQEVAAQLAVRDGLGELSATHIRLLEALRDQYFRNGGAPPTIPALHHLCAEQHLDRNCVSSLFGADPIEAWRIAGLPNPGEEVKAYF